MTILHQSSEDIPDVAPKFGNSLLTDFNATLKLAASSFSTILLIPRDDAVSM